ncbi:MAG: Rv3235 family protein [Candidatus Nanopelagicales bacterium]
MSTHALKAVPEQSWTPTEQPGRHLRLVPPPGQDVPDQRWMERLTLNLVEVLAGERSPTTLVRWLSPVVYQALRSPQNDPRLKGSTMISLRAQPLSADSIEIAAVIGCPRRTRAIALRLARRHDRWRVVCLGVL